MKLLKATSKASSLLKIHPATPPIRAIPTPVHHQNIHTTSVPSANPVAHPLQPGPPPPPPTPQTPTSDDRLARIDRKKRNAELLERGRNIRSTSKPGVTLAKRFWKDVHIQATEEGFQILLDKRAVRTPNRDVLTIPASKPHLATAIALEWDLLTSTQQALKHHYIPLTSLTARALDLATADQAGDWSVREKIVEMCMRYLTTDTLLCWAPEPEAEDNRTEGKMVSRTQTGGKSLHDVQKEAAMPILAFLTENVWPGITIRPALEKGSIMPRSQEESTTSVIRGWISGLSCWDLAGLERATLASKSVCVASRLLVEWSGMYESDRQVWAQNHAQRERFGIGEAAEACSQEVRWQTGMWGEVEDTHDVEREDMRRQLGSTVLIISDQRS